MYQSSATAPSIEGGIYIDLRIAKSDVLLLHQQSVDSLVNRKDPTSGILVSTVKGVEEKWESVITINQREKEIFSVEEWEFVDRTRVTNHDAIQFETVICPIPFPMIIVAWNARFGFYENVKHLIREHTPDILILTEIKTLRDHTKKIVVFLPFDRYELVEPNGFTGGILVLWNTANVDFQSISADLRAVHGIVQVTNKSFSFPFFLSAIYASPKFKSRIDNWCDLENMAGNMNVLWVAIGDFNDVTGQSEKLGGREVKSKRVDTYLACMNNYGLHA